MGVYDVPLKKYVNSRQPTNEVMKLEGHNVDASLLTCVDDLMDMLIENTPSSMKMRDTANYKRLTQELKKVECKLEPSKEERLPRWMGPTPEKILPDVAPGRFPQAMITQRIIAMRTSFYRYASLWKSRHV